MEYIAEGLAESVVLARVEFEGALEDATEIEGEYFELGGAGLREGFEVGYRGIRAAAHSFINYF